ncbi:PhzF family phenazine biosynthesis protein [Roseovarius faecimaris]|nr:PhzF family phenazine biosynthesis protein [Roseovarius faecimaris]
MTVQRLAAFTREGIGGNPAGVMLCAELPGTDQMQEIAAKIGYSETAFAMPVEGGMRVRYFAPDGEVPFCGHATIALGAALGMERGEGDFPLLLNDADISVTAFREGEEWGARLTSPPTSFQVLRQAVLHEALELFHLHEEDLDPDLPPVLAQAGARHLILPLARHALLQGMSYDFAQGATLMRAQGWVTINLIWRENVSRIHSRNAFAGHGVYEDPATGAAAAALAGYLRDAHGQADPFEVSQGVVAGHPSRLLVTPQAGKGAPVQVAGTVRLIES